jgi:RNA polymerase sigma factor (sigma-70 family)
MEANHGQRTDKLWSMSTILSKEHFEVIHLTYVEELTQRETARELGLSQSMVRVLLEQAYDRLRKAKNVVFDFDAQRV